MIYVLVISGVCSVVCSRVNVNVCVCASCGSMSHDQMIKDGQSIKHCNTGVSKPS